MGGSTLYVEAACVETGDGKGGLRTTGEQHADFCCSVADTISYFAPCFCLSCCVPGDPASVLWP